MAWPSSRAAEPPDVCRHQLADGALRTDVMPKRSIQTFRLTNRWLRRSGDGPIYDDEVIEGIIEAAGGLPEWDVEHNRLNKDGTDFERATVSRRQALEERLDAAARTYLLKTEWQTKPTPKQLATRFDKIETAAAKTLAALGLSRDVRLEEVRPDRKGQVKKEIPSELCYGELQAFAELEAQQLGGSPLYSGEGLLRDAVHGVCRIRDWSAKAKQHNAGEEATPREQRHSGDKILDDLLRSLGGIWFDVFNKLPTTSVSSGTQSSPAGVVGGQFVAFIEACLRPLLGSNMLTRDAIRERVRRLRRDRTHKPSRQKN
jgi:hypothetical protein